ncbi:MAG: redoxin domain-containing protein [Burkholderiales bacterium]|nr:redoxin domain-containing protein [Anaerolineae bacterium]
MEVRRLLLPIALMLVTSGLLTLALMQTMTRVNAQTEGGSMPDLQNYGPAPELNNQVWLNTDTPLRLADLRGSVVLLEFWTFDCINCIRTLPYMQQWHETYADQGLTVIGNHFPEFDYEHDMANVRAALPRLGITYAVAQDNNGATWRAYNQRYWPTIYLIDKQGNIRYFHIGEGRYAETEAAIQALLAEPYTPLTPTEMAEVHPDSLTPTDVVNVRSGPGLEHGIIGAVNPNEAFIVLEEANGWYRIPYNDQQGYVFGELVTLNPLMQP